MTRSDLHAPILTESTETSEQLLQDFDLSSLRSLRSLEITAFSMSQAHGDIPHLLHDIFSAIDSPAFSEIILVFQRPDLYRPYFIPFAVFRQIYSKRKFRLVFCLEVSKKHRPAGLEALRRRMEWEVYHQRLDFLESPPILTVSERNSWGGRVGKGT